MSDRASASGERPRPALVDIAAALVADIEVRPGIARARIEELSGRSSVSLHTWLGRMERAELVTCRRMGRRGSTYQVTGPGLLFVRDVLAPHGLLPTGRRFAVLLAYAAGVPVGEICAEFKLTSGQVTSTATTYHVRRVSPRGRSRKLTAEEETDLLTAYGSDESVGVIAAHFGISADLVAQYARRAGVRRPR